MPHVTELRVRYAETDQMGVVYHANYLVWCDVARTALIGTLGTPYAEVERSGTALAVVEAGVRYARPARFDDLIRITTRVASVRSRVVRFEYDIRAEDGTSIATAFTVLVPMSRDARGTTLPAHLRMALESHADVGATA